MGRGWRLHGGQGVQSPKWILVEKVGQGRRLGLSIERNVGLK